MFLSLSFCCCCCEKKKKRKRKRKNAALFSDLLAFFPRMWEKNGECGGKKIIVAEKTPCDVMGDVIGEKRRTFCGLFGWKKEKGMEFERLGLILMAMEEAGKEEVCWGLIGCVWSCEEKEWKDFESLLSRVFVFEEKSINGEAKRGTRE